MQINSCVFCKSWPKLLCGLNVDPDTHATSCWAAWAACREGSIAGRPPISSHVASTLRHRLLGPNSPKHVFLDPELGPLSDLKAGPNHHLGPHSLALCIHSVPPSWLCWSDETHISRPSHVTPSLDFSSCLPPSSRSQFRRTRAPAPLPRPSPSRRVRSLTPLPTTKF